MSYNNNSSQSPSARDRSGENITSRSRDDNQRDSQSPDRKRRDFPSDDKKLLSCYQGRDKRYLRWQVIYEQKQQRGSTRHRRQEPQPDNHRPRFLNKATQTDAYVVMESSLLPMLISGNIPAELVEEVMVSSSESPEKATCVETFVAASPIQSCSSSLESMVSLETSPSVLPPITPCLKGTCHFAGALRDEDDPVWLGCKYRECSTGAICKYWVHAKCHGFPKMSQRVAKLAKDFRCPNHLE